ncbi:MAG: hypothetical protein ACI8R4_002277 [Paracoccaceae bacterium]|jgi:hypothetical protein
MKFIAVFILFLGLPALANAQNVALVIGNSKYQFVTEPSNPQNDSVAISAALTAQGFDVINPQGIRPTPAPVTPAPNMISRDFVTTDQSRSVANWDAFLVKYEAQNQHPLYAFALQRRQALLDGATAERAQQAAAKRAVEQAASHEAELATARETELAAARAREENAAKEREALQAAIDLLREQNATVRANAAAAGAALPADAVVAVAPATADAAAREL